MRRHQQHVELVYAPNRSAAQGWNLVTGPKVTPNGRIRKLNEAGSYAEKLRQIGELIDPNGPIPEHEPTLGPCWIWTGTLTEEGYGPYRTVWDVLRRGAVRNGLRPLSPREVLHHLCFVRACCNPSHLERMTNGEHVKLHAELRRQELGLPPEPPKPTSKRCAVLKSNNKPCMNTARPGEELCAYHLADEATLKALGYGHVTALPRVKA